MRDYGRVYSSFWTSHDTATLSDDARLLALYLLSGPHGTLAGVCRLPDGYVVEDLRWGSERVSEAFGELFDKGFANRCGTTKWVWICRFLTWNKPENPNQWTAARKIAESVPANCSWNAEFQRVFAAARGVDNPVDKSPSETLSKPLPTQEQDQEQYSKRGKRAKSQTGSRDSAAWREALERGAAISFRVPHPSETAGGYLTAIRLAEAKPPPSTAGLNGQPYSVRELSAKLKRIASEP